MALITPERLGNDTSHPIEHARWLREALSD
jgi:hypothetical protein